MSQSVILKSNKHGINLILDDEISFEQLLNDIISKFKEAEGFFKNAKMAISFEGRELTSQEEHKIVDAITQNTAVSIICIMDQNEGKDQLYKTAMEAAREDQACKTGQFYKGTLRSGQLLECETSIVVLGDVNPAAKVISKGNIVVLGSLKGNAYAGAGGNTGAFVAALDMDPVQIKIGDIIGRSADTGSWFKNKKKKKTEPVLEPQVAIVKENNIYIEPITKGLLNNL